MTTSVGVIIPTFDRPHETIRAIESVIAQTYKVTEILVIDDGSSESNFLTLKSLLGKKPVQLIRIEPSRHPGVARETAFRYLNSDWIAFLDSDDYWHPNKISIQLELARKTSSEAICSNAVIFNPNSGETYSSNYKSGYISRKKLIKNNLIINSSAMVTRRILEKSGGIESRYSMRGAEDYVTWLRVSENSNWFMSGEELVYYREDPSNSIRRTTSQIEIDSQVQGLLGYLYSKKKNHLKSKILRFILIALLR